MSVARLLDRPTYLYAEVDRLVGLHGGTARRWINGYERAGRRYEPILRRERVDTEWATWGEFVEARMLSEFRDASVPTARLRAAVDRLREHFQVDYPLAHLRPYLAVDSGELAMSAAALGEMGGLLVVRTGQALLEAANPVMLGATLVEDESGEKVAAELVADPDYPGIKVHPERLSGQPTFEGRRVAVTMVAGLVEAGESRADVAADYGLSLDQVTSAVRYAAKHRLSA